MSQKDPTTVAQFIYGWLAAVGATLVLLLILEQLGVRPNGWPMFVTGCAVGLSAVLFEWWLKRRARRRSDYSR